MKREEWAALRVPAMDSAAEARVRARWDRIAKPLDGLGAFETIFARIGAMTGTEDFLLERRTLLVFCADNGIVREGVSQSGQEVTAAVAGSLGDGSSNVCCMARRAGVNVLPVNIGIAEKSSIPGIRECCVLRGTEDFLRAPAMTEAAVLEGLAVGRRLAAERKAAGDTVLAVGEMGIGNTTTAAAVISALTGRPAMETAGRGAGLSTRGVKRKREMIEAGLQRHGLLRGKALSLAAKEMSRDEMPDTLCAQRFSYALRTLSCVGGLDIAGICGAIIGSAELRMPVVLDGLITAAAALAAEWLWQGVREFMLASHAGREGGIGVAYAALGLQPVIGGNLAMGEGCGAVMLFPLLDLAAEVYNSHRSFADIRLEQYQRFH
ncbi:MAG: nicotinate-nucleotide--dimethylbenzimidazole phosphoribosyltransferase [Stomatobaculum sp.]